MAPIQNSIPVIDIGPYISPTASVLEQRKVVEVIRDACIQYGFFQLVGHGIPLGDQQQALSCAKMFFDLPVEEKVKLSMKNAMSECGRGYEAIGGQVLEEGKLPDAKEGIYIGEEVPPYNPRAGKFLQGPNMWPNLPENKYRIPIMAYRQKLLHLAETIMTILALGLPYGPDVFNEFMKQPVANLKLLHYPPNESKSRLGAGSHTDFGCITLLLQQPGSEGLEVLSPLTNTWIPIPSTADRYVVNVGDLLHRWTKGHYRSTVHRVVDVGKTDRYSIPFFYHGNLATTISPLDGSVSLNAITVEEHIRGKFRKSYKMDEKSQDA
ncbi:putative leucoanthocyanidin dioxygenase [Mollisia scopiformis]|uniref:Putative leucoanthocyanidin dioxygenase n=1 Tax=Mollisia scopiformis TaxID=149040 RepID=A0A194XMX2_MOLSC|nr:putative leucoanthocyanidin dioxygenase [Mollisia scopiformis]KUJ21476.1 putative leucoanthocyanidin dioxygenase [Mollisia scopiformis]